MNHSTRQKVLLIAVATILAALPVATSAAWVEKSDSWCRQHGFVPPCEVWERKVAEPHPTGGGPANANIPREGEIRRKLPLRTIERRPIGVPAAPESK